jgi:hypothetical protein
MPSPLCVLTSTFLSLQTAAPSGPPAERGLRLGTAEAAPGYVLFAPLRSRTTFLIDRQGEVAHSWPSEHPGLAVYMLEDGTLLRTARIDDNPTFHGGGLGGRIQRVAKDGSILWEYVLSDAERSLHHDIEPLANGNVLAIAWEHLTKEEAVALGRDPVATHEKGWWPCWVLEIRPTPPSGGEIVWEWHAKDHLVQDFDPAKPHHGSIPDHPERIDVNSDHRDAAPLTEAQREAEAQLEAEMRALGYAGDDDDSDAPAGSGGKEPPKSGDWLHLNGIDHDPLNDLILLSGPELCELWIIDHSTTIEEAKGSRGGRFGKGGDLLYRWGNPRMYGLGDKEHQQLFYQHQAEWIPPGMPGAGHVTVFNNGRGRPGKEYSSLDELVLPFDTKQGFKRNAGQPYLPEAPAWSYSDPDNLFSFFISGCQRLANGNTFACAGKQGRLFEVTPSGRVVWDYWNPHGGEVEMGMGRAAPPPPAGGPGGGGGPVEPTSCFRATKLAPDHPGLRALGITE